MSNETSRGYDTASGDKDADDLNRWRIASDIVRVIQNTSPDWSTRIGVLGKWGEGKTTVVRFVERQLREKDNVVFTWEPWSKRSWEDLWSEFGDRFSDALELANLPFDESWKKKVQKSAKWLQLPALSKWVVKGAEFFGRDKAIKSSFDAVSSWLQYDGPQIREIRRSLGYRRVIVILDDLDRCPPDLIPQLLLSLREVLDLPGFTFLLAFDEQVVSKALLTQNPGWEDGRAFLDKILDFRFHLPPVEPKQKSQLVAKALSQYCSFVPQQSVDAVRYLLPDNPRKLKALIRSLAMLEPEISRHNPEELNWEEIWLAHILRLESNAFMDLLLADDTFDLEVGISYELFQSWREQPSFDRAVSEKDVPKVDRIQALLKKAQVVEPQSVTRILAIVEAMRARSSPSLRYFCELAVRPPAITWKEFGELFESWQSSPSADLIHQWIAKQATGRAIGTADVDAELFQTVLSKRHERIGQMADCVALDEQEPLAKEAHRLLEMLGQFLSLPGVCTAERVRRVYDHIQHWIAYRKNSFDGSLRDAEVRFLAQTLASVADESLIDVLESLKPWEPDFEYSMDGPDVAAKKQETLAMAVSSIAPRALQMLFVFFRSTGSVRRLHESGALRAYKYLLFNRDSPLWADSARAAFFELIAEGTTDPGIYRNVRELLDLLICGHRQGLAWFRREEFETIINDQEFITLIWKTVTSRSIQWRAQTELLQNRSALIKAGVSEANLPLTPELEARQSFEKKKDRNT